mgnify:CR=1 FL=1
MSGDIDQISSAIGRLQSSIDAVLVNQRDQGRDLKVVNKALIGMELGQTAIEGRLERQESFGKQQEVELAKLKEVLEKRLTPLEGLRNNIMWAWGVLGTLVAAIFAALLKKVLG